MFQAPWRRSNGQSPPPASRYAAVPFIKQLGLHAPGSGKARFVEARAAAGVAAGIQASRAVGFWWRSSGAGRTVRCHLLA
jgi:hypothetical protein